ncbi:hypothetical protein A2U01_0068454, partial [Trifolium medium]|nr:hypothetical protein [Trifolium medium]
MSYVLDNTELLDHLYALANDLRSSSYCPSENQMAFLNMVGMFRHLLASDHPFIQAVADTKIKRDTSMSALEDQ